MALHRGVVGRAQTGRRAPRRLSVGPNGLMEPQALEKTPTGVAGLDNVTGGGLPRGRPTLVCGSAGSGKTLLGMEFIVRGITQYGEPGVFMSFEETEPELTKNVRSLGYDLTDLQNRKKLVLDFVRVERSEIEETGEYDLEGLFVRLNHAIDSVKAKRVVLDTIESLFSGLSNTSILRAELRRLFRWLKEKGVTVIITGEKGEGTLTRQGIEEYVSDCVILLDHRVTEQISTRRLRIVKYRGSTHGTNEYPFLITDRGISVVPITELVLQHKASAERVSSGVPRLDTMLGGEGYFRGSTVLVSGTSGTGKTSLAAHFVDAACRRGEKCVYLAFEESESQIIRNMRSIGFDLEKHVKDGLLIFHASRPTVFGLEMHLATVHNLLEQHQPAIVVIDPVTNLVASGVPGDVYATLLRMIDFLKSRGITTLCTTLTEAGHALEQTEANISSLIDTWIILEHIKSGGERNRALTVLKSRGMAHSNQTREYVLGPGGLDLLDVYVGAAGVLTGSARLAQEARDRDEEATRRVEAQRREAQAEAERKVLEAQIAALQAKLVVQTQETDALATREEQRRAQAETDRDEMARSRQADRPAESKQNGPQRRKGGAK